MMMWRRGLSAAKMLARLKRVSNRNCANFSKYGNSTYCMLRAHEWILLAYFWYAAAIAPFYLTHPGRAALLALVVTGLAFVVARFNYTRDWFPLALLITAYREMDWFQ